MSEATADTTPPAFDIHIERTMRAPAERIYKAFLDPYAQAKFSPPNGYVASYEVDARVGGGFKGTFRQIDTGEEHSFSGTYLALDEFTRIQLTDAFETGDVDMQNVMVSTYTFEEQGDGTTKVTIEQTNVPGVIPRDYVEIGWNQSLDLLTLLVEYDAEPLSGPSMT